MHDSTKNHPPDKCTDHAYILSLSLSFQFLSGFYKITKTFLVNFKHHNQKCKHIILYYTRKANKGLEISKTMIENVHINIQGRQTEGLEISNTTIKSVHIILYTRKANKGLEISKTMTEMYTYIATRKIN